jgi:hypothetical protein
LEVVNGYGEHATDFVILAEVGDREGSVLYSLFRVELEGIHAAVEGGAVADGSGGGAVDAHFGEEGGEVSGLEFRALFGRKAGGAEGVLNHHAPYCPKTDSDVFAA